ncbi:HAD family hydrolase [Streptomyces sannanensis]|uniref:HAD family hydrolase n=1 Tax=Streptomyces sannanensis TaxID=285536 RepID=A0ABP6SBW2_9ACTN
MRPSTDSLPLTLRHALARAECVILDFDGPICRLFAGLAAPGIAAELQLLAEKHGQALPELEGNPDPLAVLRGYAWALGPCALVDEQRELLDTREVEAAQGAEPTPGAAEFMKLWHETGRPLAIASNNCAPAIRSYLLRESLSGLVEEPLIVGRYQDVARMKPDPASLLQVLDTAGVAPEHGLMIGDALTDLQAARAVGATFVGYHRKPSKRGLLAEAGADFVVDGVEELAAAVSENGPLP